MGTPWNFPWKYDRGCAERAERILGKAREDAVREGVACDTVHVKDFPAEGIMATANAKVAISSSWRLTDGAASVDCSLAVKLLGS